MSFPEDAKHFVSFVQNLKLMPHKNQCLKISHRIRTTKRTETTAPVPTSVAAVAQRNIGLSLDHKIKTI